MAGSQSLERGLEILDLLDKSPRPLGVREISRQMDISAAIVQRLINTLAEYNYVAQDKETRRYSIGYRAFGLGWSLTRKDRLISVAKPELDRLASDHLLNCYLGVLRGGRAIYILSVQSDGPIAIRSAPGSLTYLHSTALGKALLAGLADSDAYRLLTAEPLAQVTPHTVTDPDKIMAELADIRKSGYATVRSENIQGVISVGAPVHDTSGSVIAALSTAFAEWSTPEFTVEEVAKLVMDSAARISQALGHQPQLPV
ncbi:IclR family transcriptional regulator [Neorhizobium petrolearium]|uniref:IclR family transcriptional regulator n=1 Tax=Neorhizobium petrolearium TaxID=515361 RepID=UPI001AE1A2E9|nr:IclR family transcriptional regulator [Neorhizobium petrolearium]